MYYWSQTTAKLSLEEELIAVCGVKELFIGTAFFSREGLRILKIIAEKHGLKRSRIHIFLSDEFTQDKPHELLGELTKIAEVRIFFNYHFHAKVYWMKGERNKIIYGSSNFTAGGFAKNIEFDHIEEMGKNDDRIKHFERFFEYCKHKSEEVTEEVIAYYKENQEAIEELRRAGKELEKKLKGYIRQDDEFEEDDYQLDGYFFTYEDYETFFRRNQKRDDLEIRKRREAVQRKMLLIHDKVYPKIKKLGIECHWNSKHVTSLTRPCEYNKFKVGWMGVRYGKTKREIDEVNQYLEQQDKDEIKGFQKHGCLQYCIIPDGFEINLFLAVRRDAVDRMHIQDKMLQLRKDITKEIGKLQGQGMTWEINNEEASEYRSFNIDEEDPEHFCDFLRWDHEGCESYLRLFFDVDDKVLQSPDSIARKVAYYIELLMPLYNSMVWRPLRKR